MKADVEATDNQVRTDELTASRRRVLTGAAGLAASVSLSAPVLAQNSSPPDLHFSNPDTLARPLGQYSHMTRVKASEFLFIAGQVAVDRGGAPVGTDDFDAQCIQVFANIEEALKSSGAGFSNVVEFITYLVHSQDIPKFMKFRLREFPKMFVGGAYPPNTLVVIDRLVSEAFLIEVKTVAAL
jgi:enamine deaminase RidA (YjgF/YER057c/UK114 family)